MKQNAQTELKNRAAAIRRMLKDIEKRVDATAAKKDAAWGEVGDLGHIQEQLAELLGND